MTISDLKRIQYFIKIYGKYKIDNNFKLFVIFCSIFVYTLLLLSKSHIISLNIFLTRLLYTIFINFYVQIIITHSKQLILNVLSNISTLFQW